MNRTGRKRWLIAVAATAATALMGVTGSLAQSSAPVHGAQASHRVLPDLVQILPPRVRIAHRISAVRGRRTLLTFSGAAENHGVGPLVIDARRPNQSVRDMTARQIVWHANGFHELVPTPVGTVRYVHSRDHNHWHLLDFMRYRLTTLSGARIGRDHKTGYCLGDRYRIPNAFFPAEPKYSVYNGHCGRSRPGRLSLAQGISVGFGDLYPEFLEGQFIDITDVPTGNYVLVMRVNPTGKLLDEHPNNDVSSVNVRIVKSKGRAFAKIVNYCNNTNRCPITG
jgi:hypothetical protein